MKKKNKKRQLYKEQLASKQLTEWTKAKDTTLSAEKSQLSKERNEQNTALAKNAEDTSQQEEPTKQEKGKGEE